MRRGQDVPRPFERLLAEDGTLLLLAAGLASAAFYFLFWTWPASIFDIPLRQRALDPSDILGTSTAGAWQFLRNIALPFAMFGVALVAAAAKPSRWTLTIAFAGAFGLPLILVFAYPSLSADVFDYLMGARIWLVHGENPLISVPRDFPRDVYYRPVAWPNAPYHYGPVFLLFTAIPVKLAGDNLVAAVIITKLLTVLAHGVTAVFVYLIVKRIAPSRAQLALVAYGWNPMAVLFFGVDGHNDALMLVFVAAAIYAELRERSDIALPLLTLSILVKFVPLILVPLFILHGWQHRRRLITGAALSVALTVALIPLLWAGMHSLDGIREQGGRSTSSPAAMLEYIFIPSFVRGLLIGAFACTYAAILWRIRGFAERNLAVITAYLLLCSFWLKGWYFTWPLMLAALIGGWPLLVAVVWSVAPLVFYLVGAWGWKLNWLDWQDRGTWVMEASFVVLLFAPLIIALLIALLVKAKWGRSMRDLRNAS